LGIDKITAISRVGLEEFFNCWTSLPGYGDTDGIKHVVLLYDIVGNSMAVLVGFNVMCKRVFKIKVFYAADFVKTTTTLKRQNCDLGATV